MERSREQGHRDGAVCCQEVRDVDRGRAEVLDVGNNTAVPGWNPPPPPPTVTAASCRGRSRTFPPFRAGLEAERSDPASSGSSPVGLVLLVASGRSDWLRDAVVGGLGGGEGRGRGGGR